MSKRTLTEELKAKILSVILYFLDKNPDTSIQSLIRLTESLNPRGVLTERLSVIRGAMMGPSGEYGVPASNFWNDIDPNVRRKLFNNFIVNATAIGAVRQKKHEAKHQCNIPWAILMDPTSACNLKCIGCWAAEYGKELAMDYECLNSIIEQGKEMGVHFFVYSGGEPLLRKDDLLKLAEKHSDCVFLAFTNATLIDEEFADDLLRVKNIVPAISVEGFEMETDGRRGAGSYKIMIQAMEILKARRLFFGFSTCYTSENVAIVSSEEYFDEMIRQGCKFGWFFTYIPVGASAEPQLMVSGEQRELMYKQVRNFRETKPLLTVDFWNDGEYVGGCVAGGRKYLHINANGDIEPCAFVHYSDSNIHSSTLLQSLQSPLFMEFRNHQPFNHNHLRPCPLLDNPDALTHMVKTANAKSTDLMHPEAVDDLRKKVLNAAKDWAGIAGRHWEAR